MADFSFIHAADLHLDSPLLGLAGRAPDFAERVEQASRAALDNLVALTIDEGCRFLLLSGDVFDGDLRNVRAGLFFVSRMRRLAEAGVEVFIILGNHDAENRFMAKLDFSPNVHLFPTRAAQTRTIDALDVAIHGRSFPQREVVENFARDYPVPLPGRFNIGMLHTACVGYEGEHAAYAPCTVEQLRNHGYDYWALGHIHDRRTLSDRPAIVYPGNIQGRSVRETGAKGATIVTVRDGSVHSLEHRELDAVRWAVVEVEVGQAETFLDVADAVRRTIREADDGRDGRPLALRLKLTGATPLHGELTMRRAELRNEAETIASGVSDEVWLEKLTLATRPAAVAHTADPTVAGELKAGVIALHGDPDFSARLDARIAEIRAKFPAAARGDELFEELRTSAGARARDLALALIAGEDRSDAV